MYRETYTIREYIYRALRRWLGAGIFGGALLAAATAGAENTPATSPAAVITVARFIEQVLAQDKLLEEAQIGLDIKQIELDASRDNYVNWRAELSAETEYEYTDDDELHIARKDGKRSTSPYTRFANARSREVSLDVNKRFLGNPGSFRAGMSRRKNLYRNTRYDRDFDRNCGTEKQDEDDSCQPIAVFEERQKYDGYGTEYYAQINYPLLRHDGNAESRKSYRRNVLDLQDQWLSFFETQENFLHDRLEEFLEWHQQHTRARIHRETLAALRDLAATAAATTTATATALRTSAISQAENFARDAEVQARSMQQRLAILLNDATLLQTAPRFNLQQRARLGGAAPLNTIANLPEYLRAHSRALRRIDIDMRLNALEIAHHKNRLLPALDFTLRVDRTDNKLGTATQTYDDATTDYSARMEFSYPLGGGISTKAEIAKRALNKRKLEIAYAEKLESLQADLQRLTSLLELDEAPLLERIAAAAQSARLEYKKYQASEYAAPRDLIQAYQDSRAAKLERIDRLTEYHMNRLAYDNLLDRMLGTTAVAPPAP